MKSKIYVLGFMVLVTSLLKAQTNDSLLVKSNTIENQFTEIIEKSNNWEHFKVVPKQKLYTLKKNVQDSLNVQKQLISEKNTTIKSNEQKMSDLNIQIENLQNSLDSLKNEKDSVSFFGMLLSKGLYSLVVWGIIAVLASLLLFYIYRFSKSNIVTQRSIKDLQDLQREYEDYRTKAIEKEQKIGRQLQDEINKNRGL